MCGVMKRESSLITGLIVAKVQPHQPVSDSHTNITESIVKPLLKPGSKLAIEVANCSSCNLDARLFGRPKFAHITHSLAGTGCCSNLLPVISRLLLLRALSTSWMFRSFQQHISSATCLRHQSPKNHFYR